TTVPRSEDRFDGNATTLRRGRRTGRTRTHTFVWTSHSLIVRSVSQSGSFAFFGPPRKGSYGYSRAANVSANSLVVKTPTTHPAPHSYGSWFVTTQTVM